MSKPVKELVRKELVKRFDGLASLAIVGFTRLDAVTTNVIRGRLRQKDIRMTVVKNSIARQAFQAVGLDDAAGLLDGPCAVAYGTDPDHVGIVAVVRELLAIHRESPALTVKAALLEGEVFASDRIEELSRYPTRTEAIARVAQSALSSASRLVGCLTGPGGRLAAVLKVIGEKDGGEGEGAQDAQGPEQPSGEPETPEATAPGAQAPGGEDNSVRT